MTLSESARAEVLTYVRAWRVLKKRESQEEYPLRLNVRYRKKFTTEWKKKLSLENKTHEKLKGMLGLAMRAGKIVVGTEQICGAMARERQGRPCLVIISEGASEASKKKLSVKAEFYGIDVITVKMDMEELGRILGKTYTPAGVAVIDKGFARQIKLLSE